MNVSKIWKLEAAASASLQSSANFRDLNACNSANILTKPNAQDLRISNAPTLAVLGVSALGANISPTNWQDSLKRRRFSTGGKSHSSGVPDEFPIVLRRPEGQGMARPSAGRFRQADSGDLANVVTKSINGPLVATS